MNACYQAPQHEEVVVEPAPEYLYGLVADTWRLRRQLPGIRSAEQSRVKHLAGVLVDKLGFQR